MHDRVVIYCRVSTEEQRERQSIRTQLEFLENYATLNQLIVEDRYIDDGISGSVPLGERPEGQRLLRDVQHGRFSQVLVYRLDRLGRDPRAILNSVGELDAMGVEVRSATEPFDTTTPAGKLMLTMLSGMAGFERDSIMQRSKDGTERLAREGAWLGGIVPYGYRVAGRKKDARLVVSEDPIEGVGLSEADVIRLMYRMAAEERASCQAIANRLTELGIPPSYVRDERSVSYRTSEHGKRTTGTAGIWRPSRIRNMLRSSTYRGVHQFGKRSKRTRDVIERTVPAIVEADVWEKAQATLTRNLKFSPRNTRRHYLLRGLMKCAFCGRTYVGTTTARSGHEHSYYRCNSNHAKPELSGAAANRCPAKPLSGEIETAVWADIESFLRNPGNVIADLHAQLATRERRIDSLVDEMETLQRILDGKQAERDVVIGLYRRGRIDAEALDRQLDQIEHESTNLSSDIGRLRGEINGAASTMTTIRSAEDLLAQLNERLDQPLSYALRRELVETLVDSITVDTVEEGHKKRNVVTVHYRFGAVTNCTDWSS